MDAKARSTNISPVPSKETRRDKNSSFLSPSSNQSKGSSKRVRTEETSGIESIVEQTPGTADSTEGKDTYLDLNFGDSIHHDFFNQRKGNASVPNNLKLSIFDPIQSMAAVRHEFGEHGGVNMSIENSTTFTVMEPETMAKIFEGKLGPDRDFYLYSRHFNPTVTALSRQLAALEGTEAAYGTASGMAAISSAVLQICSAGDHIVASNRLYGGTHALFTDFLPRVTGISTTFVDITDIDAVKSAIQPGRTRVVYTESVSNPSLVVSDIPKIAEVAHSHGLKFVVDNTFTPVIISPAHHGADVVIHSITKFISGASDIIAGCVCGPPSVVKGMMDLHHGPLMLLGATMNPHVASQISSRLPHLGLRMTEHSRRALYCAQRLERLGLRVLYPGLPTNPQHNLLKGMVNPGYGFGGIFCLDMETRERAHDLMRYLQNGSQFGLMAVSLGFSETLMSCSSVSTSSELTDDEKKASGISDGLVRISIGYTGQVEQRWAQLLEALIALKAVDLTARSEDFF